MNQESLDERRFLFLIGSTRADGNSEQLAARAASRLPDTVDKALIRLRETALPPFQDIRHCPELRYSLPDGNERLLLEATLDASDLVLVSPVYWYNLSATLKSYLDHWSGWMRIDGLNFKERMKGKTMWLIAVQSEHGLETA